MLSRPKSAGYYNAPPRTMSPAQMQVPLPSKPVPSSSQQHPPPSKSSYAPGNPYTQPSGGPPPVRPSSAAAPSSSSSSSSSPHVPSHPQQQYVSLQQQGALKSSSSAALLLGMSPFQYLREKMVPSFSSLAIGGSAKVGIEVPVQPQHQQQHQHQALGRGEAGSAPHRHASSGSPQTLAKEDSTTTRRTEKTSNSSSSLSSSPDSKSTLGGGSGGGGGGGSTQPESHLYRHSGVAIGPTKHQHQLPQQGSAQVGGAQQPTVGGAPQTQLSAADRVMYARPASAGTSRPPSQQQPPQQQQPRYPPPTTAPPPSRSHSSVPTAQAQQFAVAIPSSQQAVPQAVAVSSAPPQLRAPPRPASAGGIQTASRAGGQPTGVGSQGGSVAEKLQSQAQQQQQQHSSGADDRGKGDQQQPGFAPKGSSAGPLPVSAGGAQRTPSSNSMQQPPTTSGGSTMPQMQQQQQQLSQQQQLHLDSRGGGILSELSSKFCTPSEYSNLQGAMSTGNMKGRSTTEFYTIGKVVGVGSFAKVRIAWHKLTGQAVAIKTYEKAKMKDASHLRRVLQEVKVMEKLNHPRLIRLFETLESPKRIHLVMEFVAAGNLCSYVKRRRRLGEDEARLIFKQICHALDYMHSQEIIHRDVKLENVLLDKDHNSKLIDFGFSVFSKDTKGLKVFCGTPSYMAPEIVRRAEYEGKPVDVWSLGVVLYALVCGCFPFSAKSYPELYKKIVRGQYRIPDALSHGLRDLIRNMLVLDPRKRYTVAQAKAHPWSHARSLSPSPSPFSAGVGGANYVPSYGSGAGGGREHAAAAAASAAADNEWQTDPGCSEILISANPKADLNDSVLRTLDDFGVKRETVVQHIMHKNHNGITTSYYLLKQAMKDTNTLVENGASGIALHAPGFSRAASSARPISAGAVRPTSLSAAGHGMYTGGGGSSSRPTSAPAAGKMRQPGQGQVYFIADAEGEGGLADDSFIQDDDDGMSDDGMEDGMKGGDNVKAGGRKKDKTGLGILNSTIGGFGDDMGGGAFVEGALDQGSAS